MENIGIIELEGMEFKAYHGCLEQEKVRGNSFTVDFRGELDLSAAAESDIFTMHLVLFNLTHRYRPKSS